jgi:hypothetical protein
MERILHSVIFMGEPTSAIDPILENKVLDRFLALAATSRRLWGVTTISTSTAHSRKSRGSRPQNTGVALSAAANCVCLIRCSCRFQKMIIC